MAERNGSEFYILHKVHKVTDLDLIRTNVINYLNVCHRYFSTVPNLDPIRRSFNVLMRKDEKIVDISDFGYVVRIR